MILFLNLKPQHNPFIADCVTITSRFKPQCAQSFAEKQIKTLNSPRFLAVSAVPFCFQRLSQYELKHVHNQLKLLSLV